MRHSQARVHMHHPQDYTQKRHSQGYVHMRQSQARVHMRHKFIFTYVTRAIYAVERIVHSWPLAVRIPDVGCPNSTRGSAMQSQGFSLWPSAPPDKFAGLYLRLVQEGFHVYRWPFAAR
jgi:hypothetical protein